MLKKRIIVGVLAIAMIAGFTGCGAKKSEDVKNEVGSAETSISESNDDKKDMEETSKEFKFREQGMSYIEPSAFKEYPFSFDKLGFGPSEDGLGGMNYSYVPAEMVEKMQEIMKRAEAGEKLNEEEGKSFFEEFLKSMKPFATVQSYKKEFVEKNGIKEITKFEKNEILGEQDGYIYYLGYNEPNSIDDLTEKDKEIYQSGYDQLDEIRDSFKLMEIYDENKALKSIGTISSFKTKDLAGEDVDESVFKENKITMINIWATTCGPCVSEMEDLEKIYNENKDKGFNLIGIVTDGDVALDDAKFIAEKKGLTFKNIVAEDVLKKDVLSKISGTPTTLFVDSEGNIVGEPIIGSVGKEAYDKAIESYLDKE